MVNEADLQKNIRQPFNTDFLIFWGGQAVSDFGTAFSQFALPLLVFRLSGSPFNLAVANIMVFLPYLLFGLVIGAWADRANRKHLMIRADLLRALMIAFIPGLAVLGALNVIWLYFIGFTVSTLTNFFTAASIAAVPSLIEKERLIEANGRIMATLSLAQVLGPFLAGFIISVAPLEIVFLVDSLSFLISVLSLSLIKTSFNQKREANLEQKSIHHDIAEGFRYLWRQPLLWNCILLATFINLMATAAGSQQVVLATRQYGANDQGVSLFYTASGVGAIVFALLVNRLPKSWPYGRIAIGTMMIDGFLELILGSSNWFVLALGLLALSAGCRITFNTQIRSVVQATTPNELLGRISSTGTTMSWLAIPLGSLAGGGLVEATGKIGLLYQLVGALTILITIGFLFTPLNRSR